MTRKVARATKCACVHEQVVVVVNAYVCVLFIAIL